MLVYNCSDHVMHLREKRKRKSREKAVQQVREHFNTVGRWKFAVEAAKRASRKFSRHHTTRASEEFQILASRHTLRSDDNRHRMGIIDEESSYREDETLPRYPQEGIAEDDLYEFVEVPIPASEQGTKTNKRYTPQTKSQIFRYAFEEIEKEKEIQNKPLGWTDVIDHAGKGQTEGSRMKIEIVFKDLSLFLKGNGKKILSDVTGKLSPGRVTAVMGPSGAGKTTFLNALAGKAYSSITTGTILINGRPDPINCYKKVIGFVPQDDIVHGNLTVEENLWFSARYR